MSATPTQPPSSLSLFAHFLNGWNRLMALPVYERSPLTLQRKATLLQNLLGGMVLFISISAIFGLGTGVYANSRQDSIIWVSLSYLAALGFAYAVNRTGRYTLAAVVYVGVSWLGPQIGTFMYVSQIYHVEDIRWVSLISIIIASALFRTWRAILFTGLANIASVLVLQALLGDQLSFDLFSSMLCVSAISIAVIIIHIHQQRLEREKQSSLIEANAALKQQIDKHEQLSIGLTAIMKATEQLQTATDFDTLWRQGVELARTHLNIERCSIYEYNSALGEMTGTFGTDSTGTTVEEKDIRFNISEGDWVASLLNNTSEKSWVAHDNLNIWEAGSNRKVLGTGWNACTVITDHDGHPTALMYNDAGITDKPFDADRQELLGLYCATLGSIIERKRAELQREEQRAALQVANEQLRHQMDEHERLSDGLTKILNATDELLATPTLDQLWKRGTELARELLGLERNSIFVYDATTAMMLGTYGTAMDGSTVDEHAKRFHITKQAWLANAVTKRSDKSWGVQHNQPLYGFVDGEDRIVAHGWIAYSLISNQAGKATAIMFNDGSLTNRAFDPITQDLVAVYCSLLGGIVERKRAEAQRDAQQEALRESNSQLTQQIREREQLTAGLTTILETTRELMTVPNLDQLWKRGVELARERLHLERCSIFEVNHETGEIVGTYGTRSDGGTTDEHAKRMLLVDTPWQELTTSMHSKKSWLVRENLDLHEFSNGTNRIIGYGWLACTRITDKNGFPTAVLFHDCGLSGRKFDPVEQDLIGLYCSLLGSVIERKQAEDKREQLNNGLAAILSMADELLAQPNLDSIWRRGVTLARERLDLDRCAIFEYDASTNELVGTYGTSFSGEITDEHNNRFSLNDTPWASYIRSVKREEAWRVNPNSEHRAFINGANKVLAKGWVAATPVSTREGLVTAVLFNDSFIQKQPFDPAKQDLIGVFCSVLGAVVERKRAEAQLEENIKELRVAKRMADESSRIKSEFLATVSHELRTPLNAIIGFSDMLLMGMSGDLNAKQQHKMTRLRENGVRLLTLINNVLDLTRLEARRVEIIYKPFSPHEMVKRISSQMDVLAQQKNLQFKTNIAPNTPNQMVGDEQRIEQIMVNLLSNAFKFTEHGIVTMELEADMQENVWKFRVRDTGIGIPPHALNMIFEEFRQVDGSFSRAYKGSGLGLAITRNLTRLMHGHIGVESELGKGSVFTVTLPMLEKTINLPAPEAKMTTTTNTTMEVA